MRVSIFGLGYVGAVSGACLADLGHDVTGVDVSAAKVDMIARGEAPIVEELIADLTARAVASGKFKSTLDGDEAVRNSDISLISVGTPTGRDGTPDLSFVDAVVRQIGAALRDSDREHTVVIRSTVPPGATAESLAPILEGAAGRAIGDKLHLVFNPEFLREGKSVKDFRAPPFTIIGSLTAGGADAVEALYEGVPSEVIKTDPGVAESIKLLSNAWHGLKVSFANEAARILKSRGVDGRAAMEIFIKDTVLNISPAYLRPGFSFGGSCLPKDLRAMVSLAEHGNVAAPIMRAALLSNQAHLEATVDAVRSCGRKPAVMFGLAFKPGTDDLRESPYVALAERLIGKGYSLSIVDSFVDASRLMGKNKQYIEHEIPHFVDMMTTDAASAVKEADIIVYGHSTPEDLKKIIAGAEGKSIVDLSGEPRLAACGGKYKGVGW